MKLQTLACGVVILASAGVSPAMGQSVTERLAGASTEAGEALFRQCQTCHTIDKDGPDRVGPNLWGVVGAEIAASTTFRYSTALSGLEGDWTIEALDQFLENPRGYAPGTRMTFKGLSDPQQRADVIAYLSSMSDEPLDMPETAEGKADAAPMDVGLLFPAAGAELTYLVCTACHSEMIVVQQGKTRDNWDHLFDWMIEEQGMPELSPEDRSVILDYLEANYNTDRPNFPKR